MPTTPDKITGYTSAKDLINASVNEMAARGSTALPYVDGTPGSLSNFGKILFSYKPTTLEFMDTLIGRIALTLVESRLYYNPLNMYKRGMVDFGDSVTEYFVNLCMPQPYNMSRAEQEVFKRRKADVRSAFHVLNVKLQWKQTIPDKELKQAFLSYDGVDSLISGIVNSMYSSANYCEYLLTVYLIQKAFLEGNVTTVQLPAMSDATEEDSRKAIKKIRALTSDVSFMSTDYSADHVYTFTPSENLTTLVDVNVNAAVDVDTLAGAFNKEYTDFLATRVLLRTFTPEDESILAEIFADDPDYRPFTPEEKKQLKQIQCALIDKDWFMIFDCLDNFGEIYNPEGLYWNYVYHRWQIYSFSPFKNMIVFVAPTGEEGITGVTVTPEAASASQGSSIQFRAQTTGVEPYSHDVVWSLSTRTRAPITSVINQNGLLTVSPTEQNDLLYITATSVEDDSIMGTAALTVTSLPSVINVKVSPNTVTIEKGDNMQFRAIVDVEGGADTSVTWSVIGNMSSTTQISPQGELRVGDTETATSLIVRATSTANPSMFGSATVTVVDVPTVTGVTINGYKNSTIEQQIPATVTLTARVDGEGAYNREVQWQLVSSGASGTKLTPSQANPLVATLTIAANEYQNVVVSCSSVMDATKSAAITVKPYKQLRVLINGQSNGEQNVVITPTSGNQSVTLTAEVLDGPENTIRDTVQWTLPKASEYPTGVTLTQDAAMPLSLVLNIASNAIAIDETLTYTATSMTTPGVSCSFTVHITTPETITITPQTQNVDPGNSVTYSSHLYGFLPNETTVWDVKKDGAATRYVTVDGNGSVAVGPVAPYGNYTVTASAGTNPAVKANANLTVNRMPELVASPTSLAFTQTDAESGTKKSFTVEYSGGQKAPIDSLNVTVSVTGVTVTPNDTGFDVSVPVWNEDKTFTITVDDLQSTATVTVRYTAVVRINLSPVITENYSTNAGRLYVATYVSTGEIVPPGANLRAINTSLNTFSVAQTLVDEGKTVTLYKLANKTSATQGPRLVVPPVIVTGEIDGKTLNGVTKQVDSVVRGVPLNFSNLTATSADSTDMANGSYKYSYIEPGVHNVIIKPYYSNMTSQVAAGAPTLYAVYNKAGVVAVKTLTIKIDAYMDDSLGTVTFGWSFDDVVPQLHALNLQGKPFIYVLTFNQPFTEANYTYRNAIYSGILTVPASTASVESEPVSEDTPSALSEGVEDDGNKVYIEIVDSSGQEAPASEPTEPKATAKKSRKKTTE